MSELTRRGFLKGSATLAGTLGALATSASANAAGSILGANEKLRVGFIGVGGRCQAHVGTVLNLTKEMGIEAVAVCDVFNKAMDSTADRIDKKYAELGIKTKCKKYPDYRKLLEDKDIDVVCIATPDHWHAKQTIEACQAGKDVYCEKPMTKTIEEAQAVVDAVKSNNRVMQVGVQSMSDPQYQHAYEKLASGRIGKVLQGQTHYYRNSNIGMWRNYRLTEDMNPTNINWDMFLGTEFGLAPKVPFDRARFRQWRCYWDYGGGMYTDLFVHRTTRMIRAMGLRMPSRVVGGGGIYLEYDNRTVPDVATVVADFDEGCQLIVTATMCNDYKIEEAIRGHTGTVVFHGGGKYDILDQAIKDGRDVSYESANPKGVENVQAPILKTSEDDRHWRNFVESIRSRNFHTNNDPELGAAAITIVNMGVISYREGRALFFDKEARKVTNADGSWAKKWEQRSIEGGKPSHILGWHAGEEGSLLQPPAWQKLAGPWVNGVDPAAKA